MKYDFLIVGAGLFGAICAYELSKRGKRCLVIEKNNYVGGNCHSYFKEEISICSFGPHVFHTNNRELWDYVNNITPFFPLRLSVKVSYGNQIYSFPINLLTMYQIWGVKTPEEAKTKLESERIKIQNPSNFEDYYLSLIGKDLYNIFVKGYSTKQWKIPLNTLDVSLAKRLPLRFTFDDNYFNDAYQGVPEQGYTKWIEICLQNSEVKTGVVDYLNNKDSWNSVADKVIYTGRIDQYYNFQYGSLDYRTTDFVHERVETDFYQGCSAVNYTDIEVPFTRIVEHKHLTPNCQNRTSTIITKEYPLEWKEGRIPMYPIMSERNKSTYELYLNLAKKEQNVIFGGRLGTYSYINMDTTVELARALSKKYS